MVGSPQGDTIVGDGDANRLDGGVGDDELDSGGGGGEAFGGPGSDEMRRLRGRELLRPRTRPAARHRLVILNQGLDGSSLVVQGGAGADELRHRRSGPAAGRSPTARPVFAGDGCANAAGTARRRLPRRRRAWR